MRWIWCVVALIACGARTELDVSSSDGGAQTSGAVLFGGYDLADTWTWDGATWTIVESQPLNGSPSYNTIWVSPDSDAWVTTSTGYLEHFSGTQKLADTPICSCFKRVSSSDRGSRCASARVRNT